MSCVRTDRIEKRTRPAVSNKTLGTERRNPAFGLVCDFLVFALRHTPIGPDRPNVGVCLHQLW